MMASSTTFNVSGVQVMHVTNLNLSELAVDAEDRSSICSQLRAYELNHCTEVLMETRFSSLVLASRNNGFVRTAIECYNKHHNLVIRPDDIWTAIMTQFSFYINKNADQLNDFGGKKELEVKIDGNLHEAPYDHFVTSITEQINENLVDKSMKDWILPDFSTTTTDDIISCGIVFMAVTKKYFDYVCCFCCGIPYVTLEGTVDDWKNILNRLDKLKSYKLDKWYNMLKPILEEFVAAKESEANIEFWNRICRHSGGGHSGTFVGGWLAAFAVFNEDGDFTDRCGEDKWPKVDIDKIPSGSITVNVKISNGMAEYESIMFAGHIAYEIQKDDFTLKPQIGWGIALKATEQEIEKLHEIARKNGNRRCQSCRAYLK